MEQGPPQHRRAPRPWIGVVGCLGLAGLALGVCVIGIVGLVVVLALRGPEKDDPYDAHLRGTTLVEKDYDPGAGTQTFTAKGVEVQVPGTATDAATKLKIVAVDAPPAPSWSGLARGNVYEITLGSAREFAHPLQVELTVDRVRLAESPLGRPLAGWWDAKQRVWQLQEAEFTPGEDKARLQTRHLTAWGLFYVLRGHQAIEREGFSIIYPNAMSPRLGGQPHGALAFAELVYDDLLAARAAFAHAGFRIPSNRTFAFIEPTATESSRAPLSGHITVATSHASKEALLHEVAHEYFHAVQNEYVTMYGMDARRWWIEATAEYAGTLASGTSAHAECCTSSLYLEEPLSTVDGSHEYISAAFIRQLTEQGVEFRALWDVTMAHAGVLTTSRGIVKSSPGLVLNPLRAYVHERTSRTLLDQYEEFARTSFFDVAGPPGRPGSNCARHTSWDKGKPKLSGSLELSPGFSAKLLCVKAQEVRGEPITVRLAASSPGDTLVRVYALPLNARSAGPRPVGTLSETSPVTVTLSQDQDLAVVAANGGSSGTAKITVSFERSADPPVERGDPLSGINVGERYDPPKPHRIELVGLPPEISKEGGVFAMDAFRYNNCAELPMMTRVLVLGKQNGTGYLLVRVDPRYLLPGKSGCRPYGFLLAHHATPLSE